MTKKLFGAVVIATVMLSGSARAWLARYDGPASDEDAAVAVAVDETGAVTVTGTSWGGSSGNDIATLRYGPQGEPGWTAVFDGPAGGNDEARALTSVGGRVVVTGGSAGADLLTDVIAICYNPDGSAAWTARYDGPARGNDFGLALAPAGDGGVFVAGYTGGDTAGWDFLALKYGADGTREWAAIFGTVEEDYATAVAGDGRGGVYVAGSSGNPYTLSWDYLLVKYDAATGETLWTRRYNGPADESDEAAALVVDPAGNVIVTGTSRGTTGGLDFTTIKYSAAGELLWVVRYDGPAGGADQALALAVDPAGNVYAAGSSEDTTGDVDGAVVKYRSDGSLDWVRRYDGPAHGFDEFRTVAVDPSGSVYVAGSSYGSGTRADYVTIKYDGSGVQQWLERYDGPGSRNDAIAGLALDRTATFVVVTGGSFGSGTGTDYATLGYPASGIAELSSSGWKPGLSSGTVFVRDRLPIADGRFASGELVLVDAAGRQVQRLTSAAGELAGLAPGVYFAGPAEGGRPAARIVVVGRR